MRRWTFIQRLRSSALIQVAVAVCLLLQLSEIAHFALINHEICAEHGEVIHTEHHVSQGQVAQAIKGLLGVTAVSRERSQPREGHQHCLFALNGAARVTVSLASSYELPAEGVTLTTVATPDLVPARLSPSVLRLLAPKTSPPLS